MKDLRFLVIGRNELFVQHIKSVLHDQGIINVDHTTGFDQGMDIAARGGCNVLVIDVTAETFNCIDYLRGMTSQNGIEYVFAVLEDKNKEEALNTIDPDVLTCLTNPFDINEFRTVIANLVKVSRLEENVREKDRRLLHLEIINEIARKSLRYPDEQKLLWELAELIQQKLDIFNVNIFLLEIHEGEPRLILKAFAGGLGDDLVVGYSLKMGEGLSGWAAENKKSLVSGDVKKEPRWQQGFEFENRINSEVAVPIIFEDRVYGVLHVESTDRDAFTPSDLMALETVTDQMSLTFENLRLSGELREAKQLSETINNSLPVSILVLDNNFLVEYVNKTYCRVNDVTDEEVMGKHISRIVSGEFLEKFDLPDELEKVLTFGISISHSNIRHTSPHHPDKILNVTFTSVKAGKFPRIMVLIQDVTEFTQKTYQLLLLREISLVMQGVVERDKLLHLILTCVTAGFAIGFNRAFLFLVDDSRTILRGTLGVGPSSYDEAYRIWNELSHDKHTFDDYMEKFNRGELPQSTLQDLVESIRFDLDEDTNVLTETVRTKNYFHVLNAWEDSRVDDSLKHLLASKEFVTIPLIAKNQVIGVLMADNAYSGRNISLDSIEVLTMLGGSAALAIENAKMLQVLEEKIAELQKTNQALKRTQDMLIRNEKLAAIGEVSARLAHEIRNPLATIGGFAKSIPKKYEDRERTIRNANIIIDEVKRLEKILTNVLDFSKPSIPRKELTEINELIQNTIHMMESIIVSHGVVVVLNFEEERVEAEFDPQQIKQVLINVIQNALNAMPDGGALEVSTRREGDNAVAIRVHDTGKGIPREVMDNIFEPFFTTRGDGTGLGLSISNMIVQNHNGNITITSREHDGTTVGIILPLA